MNYIYTVTWANKNNLKKNKNPCKQANNLKHLNNS